MGWLSWETNPKMRSLIKHIIASSLAHTENYLRPKAQKQMSQIQLLIVSASGIQRYKQHIMRSILGPVPKNWNYGEIFDRLPFISDVLLPMRNPNGIPWKKNTGEYFYKKHLSMDIVPDLKVQQRRGWIWTHIWLNSLIFPPKE